MPAKAQTYRIIDDFEPGDTLYLHQLGNTLCAANQRWHGRSSTVKIGCAVEPIFNERLDDDRGLIVIGPEIRLHDRKSDRFGPVVGFVSSFKGDRRVKARQKSAFRRRLAKLFESDGPVVVVFMAVLIALGASIGSVVTLMIAG